MKPAPSSVPLTSADARLLGLMRGQEIGPVAFFEDDAEAVRVGRDTLPPFVLWFRRSEKRTIGAIDENAHLGEVHKLAANAPTHQAKDHPDDEKKQVHDDQNARQDE